MWLSIYLAELRLISTDITMLSYEKLKKLGGWPPAYARPFIAEMLKFIVPTKR